MNKEEYISQLMYFNRETGKPENLYTEKYVNELQNRISKAIKYTEKNCVLSDTWKDLGFCDFVPIGKIKYKSLSSKKVENLLDILKGVDKQ